MGEGQFGPLGVQRLAHRPGDAVVVGHAHHQADFFAEQAHAILRPLSLRERVRVRVP